MVLFCSLSVQDRLQRLLCLRRILRDHLPVLLRQNQQELLLHLCLSLLLSLLLCRAVRKRFRLTHCLPAVQRQIRLYILLNPFSSPLFPFKCAATYLPTGTPCKTQNPRHPPKAKKSCLENSLNYMFFS